MPPTQASHPPQPAGEHAPRATGDVDGCQPLFTVFTPTFNRAHTLPRVYQSLQGQTFRDFEWLIVDDGSTDDTEQLVGGWQRATGMIIRYERQENQGKHVAVNRGVQLAHGELFLILDSDDACAPSALERFHHHWNAIDEAVRARFSGVTALCATADGVVVGKPFPFAVTDASPLQLMTRREYVGDKWGFHRTCLLREHPYPVIRGETFVPEGLVWNRLAARYLVRFVNDILKTVEYQHDGLSSQGVRLRAASPRGAAMYYRELMSWPLPWAWRVRACINHARFCRHAERSWRATIHDSPLPVLTALVYPAALAAYHFDLRSLGSARKPVARTACLNGARTEERMPVRKCESTGMNEQCAE